MKNEILKHTRTAAALLLVSLSFSNVSLALPVIETEANDTAGTAQNIDGVFDLSYNDLIENAAGTNTSVIIPHVEILSSAKMDQASFDWFSFTVATAGSIGIFDIDCAGLFDDNTDLCEGLGYDDNLDAYLDLYDTNGATVLFSNDDSFLPIDTGSRAGATWDSFIQHQFAAPGTYYIRAGRCCVSPISGDSDYILNVSIENHDTQTEVPEPGSLALLGLGLAGLGFSRRRKLA